MKKLIACLASFTVFACASASFAVIDYTAREQIKDIQQGAATGNAISDLYVTDDASIADDLTVNSKSVFGIIVDTNTTTTVTEYTPEGKGQLLIGATGGTNKVWCAGGTTTNDWLLISN